MATSEPDCERCLDNIAPDRVLGRQSSSRVEWCSGSKALIAFHLARHQLTSTTYKTKSSDDLIQLLNFDQGEKWNDRFQGRLWLKTKDILQSLIKSKWLVEQKNTKGKLEDHAWDSTVVGLAPVDLALRVFDRYSVTESERRILLKQLDDINGWTISQPGNASNDTEKKDDKNIITSTDCKAPTVQNGPVTSIPSPNAPPNHLSPASDTMSSIVGQPAQPALSRSSSRSGIEERCFSKEADEDTKREQAADEPGESLPSKDVGYQVGELSDHETQVNATEAYLETQPPVHKTEAMTENMTETTALGASSGVEDRYHRKALKRRSLLMHQQSELEQTLFNKTLEILDLQRQEERVQAELARVNEWLDQYTIDDEPVEETF